MRTSVTSGQLPVSSPRPGPAVVELSPVEVFVLATWVEQLKRALLPTKANRKKPIALDRKRLNMSRFQRILSTSIERVK